MYVFLTWYQSLGINSSRQSSHSPPSTRRNSRPSRPWLVTVEYLLLSLFLARFFLDLSCSSLSRFARLACLARLVRPLWLAQLHHVTHITRAACTVGALPSRSWCGTISWLHRVTHTAGSQILVAQFHHVSHSLLGKFWLLTCLMRMRTDNI